MVMAGFLASQMAASYQAAKLRIYLLGTPRIEWVDAPLTVGGHAEQKFEERRDRQAGLVGPAREPVSGQVLAIPRRQARALLYRLALHLKPVAREHLYFLFWPDVPDRTARRNLSHVLSHLRRSLPDPKLIQSSQDVIGLDLQQVWSDTVAFGRLCDFALDSERSLEAVSRLNTLQQAVDLYRGPFLAGLPLPESPEYESWLAQERSTWERLCLQALLVLMDLRAERKELRAAITCARRYLAVDELAEDVHRRLISFYAAAGETSEALAQFERCTLILERELGVGPLPETRAAYKAVLHGRLPTSLAGPERRGAPRTQPRDHVPLVGRETALQQLAQAVAAAQTGQTRFVLVAGEAGIGKSRLIRDFLASLADDTVILAGTAQPAGRNLPYHSVADALRGWLWPQHQPAATLQQPSPRAVQLLATCPALWLAEVARLLPELRELRADLSPPLPVEPEEARLRLFEALSQLVLGLAAGSDLVVLCLDDLHWSDSTTLDWLAYLARRLERAPLLTIGAYRAGESVELGVLRHSLARTGCLSELMLAGLEEPAVLQLVRHVLGFLPGDRALTRRLREATGGNPFLLLETLQVLGETTSRPQDLTALATLPLPESVRQAVTMRLERLSPQVCQVLEAAAVLEPGFGFDLVRRTAGRGEMETMSSLAELQARQLLVLEGTRYRFHHDLTRRVVDLRLDPVRRQLLHRRAARALEQLDRQAVVALARHFDAGDEPEQAAYYYEQAAQQAEAVFAWREAAAHYERLLALLDQLDPEMADSQRRVRRGQALVRRAHFYFLQGQLEQRDADLTVLAKLAEASDDDRMRLSALTQRVRYLNLDGHFAEAIDSAEKGLALADRLGDVTARSRLLAQIGFAHYLRGEPHQAQGALQNALQAVGPDADPAARGRISHILGYVYYHLAEYDKALACQRDAYRCHELSGDRNRMAWDLTDMGIICLRLNRLSKAEHYLNQALALAHEISSQPAESYALNNLGTLRWMRGDYPAALEYHRRSLRLQRATGSRRGEAATLTNCGLTCFSLGQPEKAELLLRQALAIQKAIGYESGVAETLARLADTLAELGRQAEAMTAAERALATARRIDDRYGQVTALAVLARLHLRAGEAMPARASAQELTVLAQETGLVHGHILGLAYLGLAWLALGDAEQAERYATQAVAILQEQEAIEGPEEMVYLTHYKILSALAREREAADAWAAAQAVIKAKADHIADLALRNAFLKEVGLPDSARHLDR